MNEQTRNIISTIYFESEIIGFLVLWLVEMNHLSHDSYLAGGNYRMSLEIELQKEVSEGDWKFIVSYSLQSPIYRTRTYARTFG